MHLLERQHDIQPLSRADMTIHLNGQPVAAAAGETVLNVLNAVGLRRLARNDHGQASGALQTMLNYVAASPVDGWLGHFLRDSKGSNPASLGLKLAIPLNHVEATRVNGVVQFANNEVQLLAGMPVVSGLNGKLEFSETGVALGNLRGSFLGGAVSIGGGSQKDGSIKVKVDGTFSADGLRRVMPPTLAQSLGQ